MVLSGRLVQAAQASRACWLPISISAVATSSTSWTSTKGGRSAWELPGRRAAKGGASTRWGGSQHVPVGGVLGLVSLYRVGVGEHAADAAGVGVGGAVSERGPAGS